MLHAVCWEPTGPMRPVGPPLGLYVGQPGCMLATYAFGAVCWQRTYHCRFYEACGPPLRLYVGKLQAVCWQPRGPMRPVGRPLGLYVGNLQALCWQRTGPMRHGGLPLRLYVGNLQVPRSLLDRLWGCMLATYTSYDSC